VDFFISNHTHGSKDDHLTPLNNEDKALQQQTMLAIHKRKNNGNIKHPAYGYLAWVSKVNVRPPLIHNLMTKLYKSREKQKEITASNIIQL